MRAWPRGPQQRDPIYGEPGQIIEFHRQREKGGFRCGDHWEVTRRDERAKMFGFLPVSATSQINAVQMLVSLSRASQEVRLYTDSREVLKEVAIRPGQGRSAVEPMDGVAMPRNDSVMGHCEKELRQEFAQKYPSPSSPEEARLEKEIQEEVMKHEKIYRQQNAAAHEQYHPPLPLQPKHDRTQERGVSMGSDPKT